MPAAMPIPTTRTATLLFANVRVNVLPTRAPRRSASNVDKTASSVREGTARLPDKIRTAFNVMPILPSGLATAKRSGNVSVTPDGSVTLAVAASVSDHSVISGRLSADVSSMTCIAFILLPFVPMRTSKAFVDARKRGYALTVRRAPSTAAIAAPLPIPAINASPTSARQRRRSS